MLTRGGIFLARHRTPGTAPLYVEMPEPLRQRLAAFVDRTRRTLTGEVCNAIEQYLDREEQTYPPSEEEAKPEQKRSKRK
jgi:hypothetical protein